MHSTFQKHFFKVLLFFLDKWYCGSINTQLFPSYFLFFFFLFFYIKPTLFFLDCWLGNILEMHAGTFGLCRWNIPFCWCLLKHLVFSEIILLKCTHTLPPFPVSPDLYYIHTSPSSSVSTAAPLSTSADKSEALWDLGGRLSTSPNILFHSSLTPFFFLLLASLSPLYWCHTFIQIHQKPGTTL